MTHENGMIVELTILGNVDMGWSMNPSLRISSKTSTVPHPIFVFSLWLARTWYQAIVKMIDISRASKQEKDDALKESKAGRFSSSL